MDAEKLFNAYYIEHEFGFCIGYYAILVKNFIVTFFLLGESPASEFYVLTFLNSVPSSCVVLTPPKSWNIVF
jgi:hypothetical protein